MPPITSDEAVKRRLYDRYQSTHVAPRKGVATLDEFKRRAIAYQSHFGALIGSDRDQRVLDIGCGNGSLIWWLQQAGFRSVEGIDISAEQVEEAGRLGVTGVVQADLREFLPERTDTYGAIVMRDLLEHLTRAEILSALEHCYAALVEGGAVIIQVPNAESPFGARIRYSDFTHELAFTSASLSQVLRTVGFDAIRCYGNEPHIHGPASLVRFALWKIVEAIYRSLLFIEVGGRRRVVTQNLICVARRPRKRKT